eukprot:TRINITY_DN7613_c0_g1_i2.p1 TRINITY_DN7613_c0_g1~~TRINITY_DN7613_c0_g1_i2.p1  ORF type:complete len:221 (+),score=32.16 TRINITY_DN7613_c0_g1_i2:181-843(+)
MRERKLFSLISETLIHYSVSHAHIVKFYGACTKPPNLCIVVEFAPLGSLDQTLKNDKISLSDLQKSHILYQIADALDYLHNRSPQVFHRDLKSANILMFSLEPIVAKVSDFGFARTKADNQTMTKCGTHAWIAPEVLKGSRYDGKADVYSFGVLVWEVMTREQPWASVDSLRVCMDVMAGKRPFIPASCDSRIKTIISNCWDQNPENRPTFHQVMEALKS